LRLGGLLAAIGVALILAAPSAARRIIGTSGADLLFGTPRGDRIAARGGGDRIDVAGGGRDTVSCGPGVDLAAADAADRVARDCERISRRISSDPFRGGGAQHATEAEPDSFSWGSKVVATFQVGRFSSGGAQAIGFAVSSDAGRSWRQGLLPGLTTAFPPRGPFSRASDPVVAYDDAHGVWLISTLGFSGSESALLVSSSRDGLHWSPPFMAIRKSNSPDGILLDKQWIACDNWVSSPFRGHCYLSYSDIEGRRLVTQTSTDGGRTWSPPVGSPDNAGRRGITGRFAPGPQPVALPNGTLVVPLYDDDEISVVRSTNGGMSFSPGIRVASSIFVPSPGLRAAPLPSAEVGADGTIFLVWPDCRLRAACSGNDLVLATSRDGLSWTPPAAVPLGAGSQVLPGIAADPTRPGRLALAYYTESGARLSVGFVSSRDGGLSWSRPIRLSTERMPFGRIARAGGAMVGDYISTSFAAGRAVSVFTLAQSRQRGRLRQATYASSIAVP
jgi:hypothetical protein